MREEQRQSLKDLENGLKNMREYMQTIIVSTNDKTLIKETEDKIKAYEKKLNEYYFDFYMED